MAARGTTIAQAFSSKLLLEMYSKDLASVITNTDYEGEISAVGSKLNMMNFDRVTEKTYANTAMTADSLTENNSSLVIDQYKSFYWKEKTLENWLSYIKNPHPTIVTQTSNERLKNIDTYLFGLYGDVGAGNRVGTNETAGTVAVAATTGVVTGSGTAFTAAMVGRGFKATGHTKWYRVKTYTSSTSIVIEDDLDDATSAYTGGTIAGSTAYIIEAATPISITTTNLLEVIADASQKLDEAETYGYSAVPKEDRWLIVPPAFKNTVVRASGIALHVDAAYTELVKRGYLGELQGFKIYESTRLTGNNTDGFRILAGHKAWLTYADKVLEARMEEDLIGDFGKAFKDLFVYGAKVADPRRHFAAEIYATFA